MSHGFEGYGSKGIAHVVRDAIVAYLISLKSVLHNKLLLDCCFSASAWQICVLVGESCGYIHTAQQIFIEGFSDRVEGMYHSL